MKLIDADVLLKMFDSGRSFEDNFVFVNFNDIVKIIENQPTAYKPDDVKAELEQLKLDGVCNNENCVDCQYYGICDAGEKREELALDKAIEIVERGGTSEVN